MLILKAKQSFLTMQYSVITTSLLYLYTLSELCKHNAGCKN